ncbi:DUF4386 domain-containing protein [Halobacteriota archaeon]
MDSNRKTAIIVGALILIAYGVIGSLFLESSIIAMLLELISGAAIVGMAVLMFPILKPHNKNLTFGYAAIKIIDGVLIGVAAIMILSSSTLLLEVRDLIYVNSTYLFCTGFLILSYLFYQSKLVPRFISVWGVIASILLLSSTLINMMAAGTVILTDSTVIPFTVSHLPVISNELFLAVWLIVKGFNTSAIASGSTKTV